jgi:hypothetical protein
MIPVFSVKSVDSIKELTTENQGKCYTQAYLLQKARDSDYLAVEEWRLCRGGTLTMKLARQRSLQNIPGQGCAQGLCTGLEAQRAELSRGQGEGTASDLTILRARWASLADSGALFQPGQGPGPWAASR